VQEEGKSAIDSYRTGWSDRAKREETKKKENSSALQEGKACEILPARDLPKKGQRQERALAKRLAGVSGQEPTDTLLLNKYNWGREEHAGVTGQKPGEWGKAIFQLGFYQDQLSTVLGWKTRKSCRCQTKNQWPLRNRSLDEWRKGGGFKRRLSRGK